jgi:hypothetical protein
MALTVKHINGDASFLLSFEPVVPNPLPGMHTEPFRILLDPWITGSSKIFHSRLSITKRKEKPCITTLRDLPEPDLIVISQSKSDHCNEATLRQLPANGSRTQIFAEPTAARVIRSWKYFHKERVRTIPKWEDPRVAGEEHIIRISTPPVFPDGEPGEVTVAYIPQRRDASGLHGAIGITYRPPPLSRPSLSANRRRSLSDAGSVPDVTPPSSPKSHLASAQSSLVLPDASAHYTSSAAMMDLPLVPLTPTSPGLSSLRSVRSVSSLPVSTSSSLYTTITAATSASRESEVRNSTFTDGSYAANAASNERTLSVVFAPHGITYDSLHAYTTSHLISEAALPLTALLHCFDSVSNPWWLGGNVLLGAPAGIETASRLGARVWLSCHDGEKEVKGLATGMLRTRKFGKDDVLGGLTGGSEVCLPRGWDEKDKARTSGGRWVGKGASTSRSSPGKALGEILEQRGTNTAVMALGAGADLILTSEGVWDPHKEDEDELIREEIVERAWEPEAEPAPVPVQQPTLRLDLNFKPASERNNADEYLDEEESPILGRFQAFAFEAELHRLNMSKHESQKQKEDEELQQVTEEPRTPDLTVAVPTTELESNLTVPKLVGGYSPPLEPVIEESWAAHLDHEEQDGGFF